MDTQKLHDLIDRVIGKKGPLRVPAYWMSNLMNELVSHINNIATSLRAFFTEGLNQKLDCLKSLTYQEFYEAHLKNKLVEGATYHIKDYKPVLSVRETRWPIVEYPKKYDLYIIYSRNIVRYESETLGVMFFDNTAFDGYVMLRDIYSGGHKYKIKYITHDCEFAESMYWVPSDWEWIQEMTVSIYSGFEGEGIKELDLLFTIDEDNQISYVDKNTNEIYAVDSVNTKYNRVMLIKDSKYGYGNIIKYSLRTYGSIIRMQDEVNNLDVCYDFIGIKSPFNSGLIGGNVRISGYPSGYLPRISLSYVDGGNITIINSTDIEVSLGSRELIDTVFINSYRIKAYNSNIENTKFVDSSDITIESKSFVKNTVFSRSSEINCNSGVYEINNCCVLLSSYIDLTGGIYDCNLYNCYNSKITSCIRSYIKDCNWVDIKQVQYSNIRASGTVDNVKVISGDNISVCGSKLANLLVLRDGVVGYYSDKMNKVNIPTLASLVTDESSGKTVDIIIQELQGKIDALGGGGTAFTSLVEIPSWEVGDDARMYLPEQYAEQVLSGNCSIMYQRLIYLPLRVSGRNLMFLSYVYPTTGGEASLGCRLVSINMDDGSVIEDSTEIDLSAYALKTEVPEVVDNLTEGGATKALSAEQGKVLNGEVIQLSPIADVFLYKENIYTGKTIPGYINSSTGYIDTASTLPNAMVSEPLPIKGNAVYCISGRTELAGIRCLDSKGNPFKVLSAKTNETSASWGLPNETATGYVTSGQFRTPEGTVAIQFGVVVYNVISDKKNSIVLELVGDEYDENFVPSQFIGYNTREVKAIREEYISALHPLAGKSIAFIGDSAIQVGNYEMTAKCAELLGASHDNFAMGGYTWRNKIEDGVYKTCCKLLVDSLINSGKNYDIIVFQIGGNDLGYLDQLGSIDSAFANYNWKTLSQDTTIYGGIRYNLQRTIEAFPNAKIIVGTVFQRRGNDANKIAEPVREVCAKLSLPVMDGNLNAGLSRYEELTNPVYSDNPDGENVGSREYPQYMWVEVDGSIVSKDDKSEDAVKVYGKYTYDGTHRTLEGDYHVAQWMASQIVSILSASK